MSDRMRQIMLEYIRFYSPVSHVNEEELEYNETENLVELIHEKAMLSVVYIPLTDEIKVINWEEGRPVTKLTAILQEELNRFEIYVNEIKSLLEIA